ncbi:MAG: RNA polymerase sigma factor [Opitutales bacterium]|nr:RNA polymerase sigma factor [Opitutales bacterium]
MGIGTTVNRHRTTHMVDFEQTARTNYQRLYAFALQLTRNPSDAEDLTQHAFYRLAVHIQNLKEENKVKSWLYSTLYRKFIDQRRRTVKFPSVQFEETTNHVEENTKRQERLDHQTVKEMLLSLEEHLRIPLSLFYIEHYSYKEISKLLEIPVGTVMSRLHRGKAELYRKLSETPNQKTGSTDTPTR